MDLVHVTVGSGRCFRRIVAVPTRAQVRRVPIPPMMFGVRLLVMVVVLRRFMQKLGERGDVDLSH